MKKTSLRKTLEQLEKEVWDEPEYSSYLVTECHRLRKIPLSEFTVEGLRIMIGQHIGIKHLLPLAINALKDDPLAEGDFFAGDLLASVVMVPDDFYAENVDMLDQVKDIIASLSSVPREIVEEISAFKQKYA